MTEPSPDDGASDDETPRDASDRTDGDDAVDEIPPEASDSEAKYRDKHEEARENANPDQHRDEEPYD